VIEKCREYLVTCLTQVGIKQVNTTKADTKKHQILPYGEVKFEDSALRPDGSLVARYEGPGENERTLRRRTYERTEQAQVKMVCRDQGQAENSRDNLLAMLGQRIEDGHGNAILITAWNGDGEEDGSILNQEATVFIDVKFDGGIYKDKVVKIFNMETDLQFEGEISEEV